MDSGWDKLIDIFCIITFLGIATVLKLNFKLFQKHLVPTAIIAGFIGLILGSEVLGVVDIDPELGGNMVYHLMAIGFIALALKERKTKKNKDIITTGFFIINTYLFQAIIGLGISLFLVYTFFPNLFPNFGLLLPLGFAQGPGQAFSLGNQWQDIGFTNGGNIGLSIATIGFLWAILGGIPFMNYLVKRGKKKEFIKEEVKTIDVDTPTRHTISLPKSIHIDDLTVQAILIGLAYLLTYLFIFFAAKAVAPLGTLGESLTGLLWGFNFLIGTLFALLIRGLLNKLKKKNILSVHYADNYLLQRISALAFDLMITTSIAIISISALREYLIPVILVTTIGGALTMLYCNFYVKRIYGENVLEHVLGLYGMYTGTATTGIALLREVDPEGKSHVAEHMVLGSGVAAGLGIPLMLILAIPITGYLNNDPRYYVVTFIVFALYMVAMNIGMFRDKVFKKRKNK